MSIVSDFHMHTPLCGHASGEPFEYVEHAIKMGLKEIGFSDHAPFVKGPLPGVTMTDDEFPTYLRMIEAVQKKYSQHITVKVSLEADFLPGYEDKTKKLLKEYSFDYIIGSVHFIGEWAFDDPSIRATWDQTDVNRVYREYYKLLRESAKSGMFDIIAHCDLIKKFGHRPTEDLTDEVKKTADVFKKSGVTIEINTSGLRKPVKEMYPSLENLKIYCEAGVPLTFGSDAHLPTDVGKDFDKALILAKQAGYTEYVTFKKRKIERIIKL